MRILTIITVLATAVFGQTVEWQDVACNWLNTNPCCEDLNRDGIVNYYDLAATPAEVEMADIIVPDDYSTISAAVSASSDGDTIFVKAGTYTTQLTLNSSNCNGKDLTIKDYGDGTVSVKPEGTSWPLVISDDDATGTITFENITFDVTGSTRTYCIYSLGRKNLTFNSCTFINPSISSNIICQASSGTNTDLRELIFDNCEVAHTSNHAEIFNVTDGSLFVDSGAYTCYNDVYSFVKLGGNIADVAIKNLDNNNTIFNLLQITGLSDSSSFTIQNNQLANITRGIMYTSGSDSVVGDISILDNLFSAVPNSTSCPCLSISYSSSIGNVMVKNNTFIDFQAGIGVRRYSDNVYITNNTIEINHDTNAGGGISVGDEVTGETGYTITNSAQSVVTKSGAFQGDIWATVNMKFAIVTAGDHGVNGVYDIVSVDSADQITLAANATDGVGDATTSYAGLDTMLYSVGSVLIENNSIKYTGSDNAHGISVFNDFMEVRNNYVDSADYGIVCKRKSCVVEKNIVIDCSVINIYCAGSVSNKIISNTSINTTSGHCFSLASHQSSDTAFNNLVRNNIFAIFGGSGKTVVALGQWNNFLDYNCYYTDGVYLGSINGTNCSSIAEMQTAWQSWSTEYDFYAFLMDAHSLNANPLFVDVENGDFTPTNSAVLTGGIDGGYMGATPNINLEVTAGRMDSYVSSDNSYN